MCTGHQLQGVRVGGGVTTENRGENVEESHDAQSVLGFLATGTFQQETCDGSRISRASMSCILRAVINSVRSEFIEFPFAGRR